MENGQNLIIILFLQHFQITYLKKKEIYEKLKVKQTDLKFKIEELEYKNSLLTKDIDLDFIEVLIRDKFLFGKDGETTYIIKYDGQN